MLKKCFMLNSAEHEFFLLINVKIPTTVGILMFMSKTIEFLAYLSLQKAEFPDILILMSIYKISCSAVLSIKYL